MMCVIVTCVMVPGVLIMGAAGRPRLAAARHALAWPASLPEQLAHSPHTSTTALLLGLAAERCGVGGLVDGGEHPGAVHLGHRAALLAGEHELALLVAGVAGEEGVAALEAMHDARGHQRIDGAVDRDRRQPVATRRQPLEHLVGADRPVRSRGNLLEHRLAQRREPQTLVLQTPCARAPWPRRGRGRGRARVPERPCWEWSHVIALLIAPALANAIARAQDAAQFRRYSGSRKASSCPAEGAHAAPHRDHRCRHHHARCRCHRQRRQPQPAWRRRRRRRHPPRRRPGAACRVPARSAAARRARPRSPAATSCGRAMSSTPSARSGRVAAPTRTSSSASAYANSLALAKAHGARSLAFPAISTGVYGFPADRAARLAVKTVADALRGDPHFVRVIFCCFSVASAEHHKQASRELGTMRPRSS